MQSLVTSAVFMTLSVGIHWAILSSSDFNVSEIQAQNTTKATIVMGESSALSALAKQWTQQLESQQKNIKRHINNKVNSIEQIDASNTLKKKTLVSKQPAFNPTGETVKSSGSEPTAYIHNQAHQTSLLRQYGALLRASIDRKKTYSDNALSDELEGTVTLNITVQRSGRLSKVALLKSSGHIHLDNTTLDIVKSIHTITPAPQALHGNHFNFTIPVIYRID